MSELTKPSLNPHTTNYLLDQPTTVPCLWMAVRKAIEAPQPDVVPTEHVRAITWSYLAEAMGSTARAKGRR